MGTLFAPRSAAEEWFIFFTAMSLLYNMSAGMMVICAPESAMASALNTMGLWGDWNWSVIAMQGSEEGATRPPFLPDSRAAEILRLPCRRYLQHRWRSLVTAIALGCEWSFPRSRRTCGGAYPPSARRCFALPRVARAPDA